MPSSLMDLGSFHSPVKQEPPKAVIANAVVAAGNPPPSGGGGRQDLETSHPGEKPPMLHTCIIDEESVLNVNTALEVAKFFRLRASEAKERLSEIRKAVSYWREEALRVNARSVEIAVMKEAYEYCLRHRSGAYVLGISPSCWQSAPLPW